jgi:hypothetical protein
MRTASIPLSAYAEASRGSRHWRACDKAMDINPDVVLIGTVYGERFYRVAQEGHHAHVVRRWCDEYGDEQVSCDCEAATIPLDPTPCFHAGSVLMLEHGESPRKLASMGRKQQ